MSIALLPGARVVFGVVCGSFAGGGAHVGVVSTYALVVDDLDDGGKATGEGAVALKEDNTANLDEAPVGCDNGGVTHFYGVLGGCRLVG